MTSSKTIPVPEIQTTARMRQWELLSGSDFQEMDRASTVAVVSCSPLEVHGPHLPTMTDYHEADALSIRTMELLSDQFQDIQFVRLPPLYIASDVVPHPGSVMFHPSTITRVIKDLGRSLAAQGFRHIWVVSFHGGPRHFVPIEIACDAVSTKYDVSMVSVFSVLLKQLTGGGSDLSHVFADIPNINHALLRGDTHAGLVETSMMLHLLGDHVKGSWKELGRRTVASKLGLSDEDPKRLGLFAQLASLKTKLKHYEDETYTGAPAGASPEAGEAMIETLSHKTAETLARVWTGELHHSKCHSPLWPLRWVFASDAVAWAVNRAVQYRTQVF